MRVLTYSAGLLAAILLTGCTHSVKLNPQIGPTASIAKPVDLRLGLYIPEDVRGFVITDRPDLEKFVFEVGESLESIVTRSANRVFSHVSIMDAQPTREVIEERNLDLVAIPKVTSAMMTLNQEEGPFQNDARGSTLLSLELTFYDAEMILYATVAASGMGIASERMGIFSRGQREYAVSVENALTNLSNDLVRQMYGNYDIRKKGEGPE